MNHCKHEEFKNIDITGTDERITICVDCGEEL